MANEQLWVPKKTGSYADALVTLGVADLIEDISFSSNISRTVKIQDCGENYVIKLTPKLEEFELEDWRPNPGYPYIQIKKEEKNVPLGSINYEKEKEVEKQYRELLKSNSKKKGKEKKITRNQGLDEIQKPRNDIVVLKTFNSMRMGSDRYNQLNLAVSKTKDISKILSLKLSAYGFIGTQVKKEENSNLEKLASSLQLFNPIAGKGVNRPKPDSTSPSSISPKLVDWFEEWMKYRAFHKALVSYNCGNDGKDTKVLVIAPGEISVEQVKLLREELLNKKVWGSTSTWIDIQAIMMVARILIEHSTELRKGEGTFCFKGRKPNSIVKGLFTAYFKNLGTASAVMNVSFIGLPGWLEVNNFEQAENWLAILKEHENCLKSLDERHSSDVPLLLKYRDYISSGDIYRLLEFLSMYAIHFMQLKAQNKWVETFTTINLRRLFMSSMKEIIENAGFQNMATAIRKATINSQIRKAMTGKSPFEIHYGLAQNWKRKAKFKHQFTTELSEFVHNYNNENARHLEQGKETRKLITIDDLKQVIDLVENDQYGSELVCMLLLAFGYARDSKEPLNENEKVSSNQQNDGEMVK